MDLCKTVQPFLSRRPRKTQKSVRHRFSSPRVWERDWDWREQCCQKEGNIRDFFWQKGTFNFRNFESTSSKFKPTVTILFVCCPCPPDWHLWAWDMLSEWRRHLKVWHFVESRSRKEGRKTEKEEGKKPFIWLLDFLARVCWCGRDVLSFPLSLKNWGICLWSKNLS